MKTFTASIVAASAFTAAYAQGNVPIIQSPASLVTCQPALLSFSGGQAPYYISVLPGGQPSATPLVQFPVQNGNSYTWTVNLPAGSSYSLQIRDSTGAVNYSSELPVQAGTDTSCIGQSASGSGSSTTGAPIATSAASNSLTTRSTVAVTTSNGSVSTVPTTSSSAASSTMTTSSRPASSSAPASSGTAAGAQTTSAAAPTGAASAKYIANMAGVVGLAGLVAYLA